MPRQLAMLVNPTSGKGRGARLLEPVAERLRRSGATVDIVVGRDADEAFDRLRDQVAAGVDGVVAVGGDGLVNLALQVVGGTGVPLGIVPAGTGNDIARSLGLVPGDPLAAAGLVAGGHTR
ncbi:MAG: sphingosine kinase, partial [Nocardioides sp.]|nr:sphingosine kinase [Nocardioides sp.]